VLLVVLLFDDVFVGVVVEVKAGAGKGKMVRVNDDVLDGNHEIPKIPPPIITFITDVPVTLV
jgi:hypothetical protein